MADTGCLVWKRPDTGVRLGDLGDVAVMCGGVCDDTVCDVWGDTAGDVWCDMRTVFFRHTYGPQCHLLHRKVAGSVGWLLRYDESCSAGVRGSSHLPPVANIVVARERGFVGTYCTNEKESVPLILQFYCFIFLPTRVTNLFVSQYPLNVFFFFIDSSVRRKQGKNDWFIFYYFIMQCVCVDYIRISMMITSVI